MANSARVRASQVAHYARLDAGFHIALQRVADRVEALKATMDASIAIEWLQRVPLEGKQALQVLQAGSFPRLDSEKADRLCREYPFLALALIQENAQGTIHVIKTRIDEDQTALQTLIGLTSVRQVEQADTGDAKPGYGDENIPGRSP